MGKEYQRIYLYSDKSGINSVLFVTNGENRTQSLGPIFDGAKKVYIDLPVGDRLQVFGVDDEEDAVYLGIESDDKMPEVCIYDKKSEKKWCNYKVFRSGKDPEEIRLLFNKLADALDILEHTSPAVRETLEHIVVRFNIADSIDSNEFGYAVSAYTEYKGTAPTCEITVSAKWLKEGGPMLVARMISHELGHCQEAYHRRIRYMGPRSGEWVEKGGKVIPVGDERAAEHFSLRVVKRA